jgi:hypothetical protein
VAEPKPYEDQKDKGGQGGLLDTLNPFNDKNDYKPGRELARASAADWSVYRKALESGDLSVLGMDWATQQQLIGAGAQAASAQQQAGASELNRAALAGTPVQAGAITKGTAELTDQGQKAAAQTAAAVGGLQQKIIDAEIARIRGDAQGIRDYRSEMVAQYIDYLLKAGTELAKLVPEPGEKSGDPMDPADASMDAASAAGSAGGAGGGAGGGGGGGGG